MNEPTSGLRLWCPGLHISNILCNLGAFVVTLCCLLQFTVHAVLPFSTELYVSYYSRIYLRIIRYVNSMNSVLRFFLCHVK